MHLDSELPWMDSEQDLVIWNHNSKGVKNTVRPSAISRDWNLELPSLQRPGRYQKNFMQEAKGMIRKTAAVSTLYDIFLALVMGGSTESSGQDGDVLLHDSEETQQRRT